MARVPTRLIWSPAALDDLQRFADFLMERHPDLAARIGEALVRKTELLRDHPEAGRPVGGSKRFRELVVPALGATYLLRYEITSETVLILSVKHSRELRA